ERALDIPGDLVELWHGPSLRCGRFGRQTTHSHLLPCVDGYERGLGLTKFWLWNHDLTFAQGGPSWCARDDVSQREFSIPIDPGPVIVNAAAKAATVGQPYSERLTAGRLVSLNPPTTGSDMPAAWSVQSG